MRRGAGLFIAGVFAALLTAVSPAASQDVSQIRSPILTIEPDRLFADSAYGRRAADQIEQEGAALAAENRKIEAELNAEEKALTEKRKTTDPKAFGKLADAFDAKVQRIRKEQDDKLRKLNKRGDELKRKFLKAARPILATLMRETGAAVIVERRSVFLSADVIDVTDRAIARIDKAIGDGSDVGDKNTEGDAPPPLPGPRVPEP